MAAAWLTPNLPIAMYPACAANVTRSPVNRDLTRIDWTEDTAAYKHKPSSWRMVPSWTQRIM